MSDNYYGWYPLVVDLVKSADPALKKVGNTGLILSLGVDIAKFLPCAMVDIGVPDSVQSTSSGLSSKDNQVFTVMIRVPNLPSNNPAKGAEIVAGSILTNVAKKLKGAKLFDYANPIKLQAPVNPLYTIDGFTDFGLVFSFEWCPVL